jgi:guanylate kinase
VHGNYYGTNLDQVLKIRDQGKKVCILDIDVKGARDIHTSQLVECNYIFVKTPSLKNLEERLIARGTETPETLKRRLANAQAELTYAEESGLFLKVIMNDSVDRFLAEAKEYIMNGVYKGLNTVIKE